MTDLTPEAAALFKEARGKHDPTDADGGRVLGALHARLGMPETLAAASLPEAAAPAASTQAATTGALLGAKAMKLVIASIVIGGTVGATLLGSSGPKTRSVARVEGAPIVIAAADTPDAAPFPEPPRSAPTVEQAPAPVAARATRHGRSHARTRREPASPIADRASASELPSEVALIRRALTSLRDRDPQNALMLLQTHASQYPDGLFKKEREGARVLALCAAGRVREGQSAKADFLSKAGSSPIAARVQLACRDE